MARLVPPCLCIAHTTRSHGNNLKQVWKCWNICDCSGQAQIMLLTCSYLTSIGKHNKHLFGHNLRILSQTWKICLWQQNPAKSCIVWAYLKLTYHRVCLKSKYEYYRMIWTAYYCFARLYITNIKYPVRTSRIIFKKNKKTLSFLFNRRPVCRVTWLQSVWSSSMTLILFWGSGWQSVWAEYGRILILHAGVEFEIVPMRSSTVSCLILYQRFWTLASLILVDVAYFRFSSIYMVYSALQIQILKKMTTFLQSHWPRLCGSFMLCVGLIGRCGVQLCLHWVHLWGILLREPIILPPLIIMWPWC